MTVVNPKSISGITSITTASGSDNLLTIHTSDANNTERLRIDSTGTTKIVTGIVTTLTATTGIVTTLTANTVTSLGDVDIADKIVHTGDTNTAIRFPAADTITTETGGSERVRITSDGDVGIGINSPARILHLHDSSSDTCQLHITNSTTGTTGNDGISFALGSDESLIINQRESNHISLKTADTERVRIDSDGRVGIKNTNMSSFNGGTDDLVIGNGTNGTSPGMTIYSNSSDIGSISFRDSADTGISGLIQYRHVESPPYMRFLVEGTETAKFTTHGGIAFGSDTAAVNTLDDYEEGTYTPTITFDSDDGNKAYASQGGSYTKIGRKVTVFANINLSNRGTGSGLAKVSLPFTVGDRLANTAFDGGGVVYYFNQLLSSVSAIHLQARGDTTTAELRGVLGSVSGNFSDFGYAYVSNSTELRMTVTYFT